MFKHYITKNHDRLFVMPLEDNSCRVYVFNRDFSPKAKFKCSQNLCNNYISKHAKTTFINKEILYFMMESILNKEFKDISSKYVIGDLEFD